MRVRLLASSILVASLALFGCGGGAGGGPTGDAAPDGGEASGGSPNGGGSVSDTPGSAGGRGASGRPGTSWGGGGGSGENVGAELPDPEPEPTVVRYVSPDGDDGADGSEATPWETLAHAVANAEPGMRIVVMGGSWDELVIEGVDGAPEAPIVLAGAEGARPVFNGPVQVKSAHWVLEGIEIASTERAFSMRFTGEGSHDNVIRNSVIHGGTGAAGISIDLGASRITIEGNEVFEISRGETDAHGIIVQPTVSQVAILGNEIHDTSGDSVQCIGPGQDAVEGAPANGVVIEGNTFYANRENAVDIKHCENVEIRGNVLHGFRKSATSNGEAIVVHLLATNVTVEGNDISDSSRGVVTGRGATNVMVRRNVIHDLADEQIGVIFGEGSGFAAIHNTIVGAEAGVKALDGSEMPVVRNNLFESCATSVTGDARVEGNFFSGSPAAGDDPLEGDAMLDESFAPAAGSPAIDAATAADEDGICGAAADFGAVESC